MEISAFVFQLLKTDFLKKIQNFISKEGLNIL